MFKTSVLILTISCFLSFLCFIPAPINLSYEHSLISWNVFVSFLCIAASSFPMLVDCILDLSAKWNLINFEYSSFNDTYLIERCIIFLGYIYPSLGYFIALVVSPSQIGVLYWGLTNSQTIWIAGAFLAIIHTSKRNIWTVEWVLFLLLGLTGNTLAVPYTDNIAVSIFYYVCIVAQVVVFLFLYSKTILLAMRKARTRLSQSDYFCLMYSTLIFFMFFVQIVIPGVISELYNEEVTLIYTNIALVVCITLASIIPNRAKQIKLQSTEQSLAMRQAFVRYLSHEMRTPINVALVGLTIHEQYLEENSLRSSECREVLLDVRTAIGESLDTLNEVLNYEKLQSKVMVLEKKKESPVDFIVSSLRMFRMPAQSKGIFLVLPEPADHLHLQQHYHIEVDPHKMSQVLRNFVSNAVKFSSSGGTITVSMRSGELQQLSPSLDHPLRFPLNYLESCLQLHLHSSESMHDLWLEISVIDTGIGIAPENIHRVFNEMIQIKPNENQGGSGSGMGLYISKGIVELHGGKVEVHSGGLGMGCRFSMLLPLQGKKEDASEGPPSSGPSSQTAVPPRDVIAGDCRVFPFERDLEMQQGTDDHHCTHSLSSVQQDQHPTVHVDSRSPPSGWVSQRSNIDRDVLDSTTLFRRNETSDFPVAEIAASSSVTAREENGLGTQSRGVLAGRKILMVDDSPPNLKLCCVLVYFRSRAPT